MANDFPWTLYRWLRLAWLPIVVTLCWGMLDAQAAVDPPAVPASTAASSGETASWAPPGKLMLYGVPVIVLLGSLLAILSIQRSLIPTSWSLADALSEEVELPGNRETIDSAGAKTTEPVLDGSGKPVLLPQMRASSSRVIALMGMVVLLFMYIGFGVFALHQFGAVGRLPAEMDGVVSFLLAGMTLFAPYVVNKFSSLFKGLSGGK